MGTFFWERDGVVLRSFRSDDAEIMENVFYATDYRMAAEHGITLPVCEGDGEAFVEWTRENDSNEIWLAIANENDTAVGYCVLRNIDERNGNLDLFLTIFPNWQRRHYAAKACFIVCDYAYHERRMYKINSCLMERNKAGQEFIESCGFLLESIRSDMFYSHNAYWSAYEYGMTIEDFDAFVKTKENQKERANLHHNKQAVHQTTLVALREQMERIKREQFTSVYEKDSYFWEYEGIRLRELREEDCLIWHELLFDSESCRYYDNDVKLPFDVGELTEFDRQHLAFGGDDNRLVFTVEDLNGNYIGNVQLCGTDYQNGTCSFSVYVNQTKQGKGFGTKAVYVLLCYAFFELRMHKCITTVNEGNIASLTLMRRLGFTIEGIKRRNVYYKGKFADCIQLGLTKEAFTHHKK
jgi:RimJ/RimL family protein N-acetyltransferase